MPAVPWLLDLRSLQSLSEDAVASGFGPDELADFLSTAPPALRDPAGVILLDADPAWAVTASAAVLLRWLRGRRRHVCWTGWLSDAARDALLLWHGSPRLCVPLPRERRWHWQEPPRSAAEAVLDSLWDVRRERLAYFSPMPPQRSGISDYSLALLPALAAHFEIDVVACDPSVSQCPPGASALVDIAAFRRQRNTYHHVLYHLGNSTTHLEMVALLEEYPGTVVLHDFYLSHGLCSWEAERRLASTTSRRLYEAHGYRASLDWQLSQRQGNDKAVWAYPCNLAPLRRAAGVIVHSREAQRLARRFLGAAAAAQWTVIPHLKQLTNVSDRLAQRAGLGIGADQFVLCSFGFIGRSKLSVLLLQAFLGSQLAADPNCMLVLAGSVGGDDALEQQLQQLLRRARERGGLRAEVRLTGWINTDTYQAYQAAADAAVQLRTSSRGESSGTVLDCLAAGIPLIYNAHGSLAELPQDCGLRLPDFCSAADVRQAMERLRHDPGLRRQLAERGRAVVLEQHRPEHCAALYAAAIRQASLQQVRRQAVAERVRRALSEQQVHRVEQAETDPAAEQRRLEAATALTLLLPPEPAQRQLLLDVTALAEVDLGTGVQRVVRSICEQLLSRPPAGWRVEPVRASREGLGFLYARQFTAALLGLDQPPCEDSPVLPRPGDLFLGVDLHHDGVLRQAAYLQLLRAQGVAVHFVVYDLLPCQLPECFPPGAAEMHQAWLEVVARCDGALGISRSVASELATWLQQHPPVGGCDGLAIGWFSLGCDFQQPRQLQARLEPDQRVPEATAAVPVGPGPTLVMVGTVEPRKGYLDVIEAVSVLWQRGLVFNLVIVGREGWTVLPEDQRRTIPRTVAAIRSHPLLGQRLFWLEDASDAELDQVYRQADGLIGASYGEGFGLPLIEAASYGLPLLLRELPVFQEVTQGQAVFFPLKATREQLAAAIAGFLGRLSDVEASAALAATLQRHSWRQSADQLLRALGIEPSLRSGLEPEFQAHPTIRAAATGQGGVAARLGKRQRFKKLLRRQVQRWRRRQLATVRAGQPVSALNPIAMEGTAWFHDLRPDPRSQPVRPR